MPKVAIIVPCYNEASRLDVGAFLAFGREFPTATYLFVNDGSRDETLSVLEALKSRDPERFAVLNLPKNVGKAEAVRQGLLRAFDDGADYVGFWDADLATPLEAVPSFCSVLDHQPNIHVVCGARVRLLGRSIERSTMRHYLGRLFATAVSLAFRIGAYDTQCGAKLFRNTPRIRGVFEKPFLTRWIFDVEILVRFCFGHGTGPVEPRTAIHELPLMEWREVGGSKLTGREFVRLASEFVKLVAHSAHDRPRPTARPASTVFEGPHFHSRNRANEETTV